jgi:putative transposase
MRLSERRKMVEPGHALSLVGQTVLLGLHRSGWYYRPVAVSEEDLALMALLDKQYLKTPFYRYWKMTVFFERGRLSRESQASQAINANNGHRSHILPS